MTEQKTQGFALHLLDVNNLLYMGDYRFGKFSVTDVQGREFKTGGMYMVLNVLRNAKVDPFRDIVVFCFDRQSFRKQLNPYYKSSRPRMPPHLLAQANELYKWLPKVGYNAIAIEGLEADDVIASIHKDLADKARLVNIYTTDRDLAHLVDDKTTLVSLNSKVPSVNKQSYEATVGKRGHWVAYNSVYLYKSICGDNDDIPSVTKYAYAVYNGLIQKLKGLNISPAEVGTNLELIEPILKMLPIQYQQQALDNWETVRPQAIDTIEYRAQKLNQDVVYEFCSIFGLRVHANLFGVELREFADSVTKYRVDLIDGILKSQQANYHEEFVEEEPDDLEPEEPADDAVTAITELQRIKEEVKSTEAIVIGAGINTSAHIPD